jgi:FkbM family methyltransferase
MHLRPGPMRTVDITYGGRTVALPDLPEYAKFYAKLSGGSWEPGTFETLSRNLDCDTVYIDIGAWIGVTPMWSAQIAKSVVAVEPDPKCTAILKSLAARARNVTVLEAALSPCPSVIICAVDGFGSSETSILNLDNSECVTASGLGIDEILSHAGSAPVFIKIDIEGYEFAIRSELAKLRNYPVRGVQIAIHPQLYERSLKGNRLWRRVRTAWATWQIGQVFKGFLRRPSFARFDSLAGYVIKGVLFRRKPKGADLVFERHPARDRIDRP